MISSNQSHGFLWTASNGMQDLAFDAYSSAVSINDNDLVLGGSISNNSFLWSSSGGIQSLDFPGSISTDAIAINNNGQVVALDMEGREIWKRHLGVEYGSFLNLWGHGSSPALYKNLLILL